MPDQSQTSAPANETETTDGPARLLIVTGVSGAGRSSVLKMLEDLGYEAVDNLPLSLLPRLIAGWPDQVKPLAVGIDVRTRDFEAGGILQEIEALHRLPGYDVLLVFIDCDDEVLERRFTETRRRHPLAGDRPVMDGIRLERDRLLPLRARADVLIDTTNMRLGDLKQRLQTRFGRFGQRGLSVFVTSFSFREGLPRDADLVFDVRFLENPHYDPLLRPLTGRDPRVGAFIRRDPSYDAFWTALTRLLEALLPRYDREGKSYLTIAIGCTGGRHRSVFVAEELANWLRAANQAVTIAHRDCGAL